MSNRSSNTDVANLSLEILKRIPKKRKITAKEIQQQLQSSGIDRSLRTIQRNLDMLSRDFDIEKDESNKPYGYRWVSSNSVFSVPTLSPKESVLLNLTHEYLANLLPPTIMQSLDGFFSEAQYQLCPNAKNQKEREWLKKVRVVSEGVPMLPPEIDTQVFEKVSEALFHNRLLNIEYYNSLQEYKSAQVMPLGLAQQGKRLYLVCRFDGYEDVRNIAIHRVQKAIVSTFTFERPSDFKLSQYDAEGRFGFAGVEKCQLEFCINKYEGFHLLETPLSKDQQVVESESHYLVTATVVDSLRLNQWLKGFGENVWDIKKLPIEK
ncbi:WYL domain-containing protein [Vibrio sp. CK2-1]|uniref:helix-turn-helix transcriptional regulator n=1 Tax=Vibrio sp. CK2-1 TaxID=2912249 RepID=UPI001F2F8F9C|nr:WYL domain-containing protein [Vibrio sp. CK2-1]MCF7354898.1 WYL domain-containing protein [Vibrio sp. CK2-1]